MIERAAEESGLLDYCREQNIGVVAYSPIQKGLLTGNSPGSASRDYRRRPPPQRHQFQRTRLSANFELVEKLTALARTATPHRRDGHRLGIETAEVTSAIVGARRPAQSG